MTPKCVEKELLDFAKHDDYLGKRASEALERIKVRDDPLTSSELDKEKESLGLGGGGVTRFVVATLE